MRSLNDRGDDGLGFLPLRSLNEISNWLLERLIRRKKSIEMKYSTGYCYR